MLKKTSDIEINTKNTEMIKCFMCGSFVKKSELDPIQHVCKNCNKDLENGNKKHTNPIS